MATVLKPNGKPGHSEVFWSPLIKWASLILASLIVVGAGSSFGAFVRLAVVEHEMGELKQIIVSHAADREMHERDDAKRERIRDEIDRHSGAAR